MPRLRGARRDRRARRQASRSEESWNRERHWPVRSLGNEPFERLAIMNNRTGRNGPISPKGWRMVDGGALAANLKPRGKYNQSYISSQIV